MTLSKSPHFSKLQYRQSFSKEIKTYFIRMFSGLHEGEVEIEAYGILIQIVENS